MAAAIFNLTEDTATAQMPRSQEWQRIRHRVRLKEGATVTPDLVRKFEDQEIANIRDAIGPEAFQKAQFDEAREIFEKVALGAGFVEFLTLSAHDYLD